MRIALAQINPTIGDFRLNVRKHLDFIGAPKTAGRKLVVFPELAVTGYPPRTCCSSRSSSRTTRALNMIASRVQRD